MKEGGHIRGYKIDDSNTINSIAEALEKLADEDNFMEKYGSRDVLLYAMGDGNHSLATAKAVWEEIKRIHILTVIS